MGKIGDSKNSEKVIFINFKSKISDMQDNLSIEVINIEYPKKKKERIGKAMDEYVAQHYKNKGYKVLFSKVINEEINYSTFLKDYPYQYDRKYFEDNISFYKRILETSKRENKKPSIWINGKQLTQEELRDKIKREITELNHIEELNKNFQVQYLKFKENFSSYCGELRKMKTINGKPDLFVYNWKEFFFCEVKSHNDSWNGKQVAWHLQHKKFPYRLVFVK
ncbi:MAG: hypothetical protein UR15_C0022G0006 [Parcubacteria group bacterium GW2011_GWA2_31_28]|nr:MAG: hypothetical protein UR15_C0022G0006 [Parcubacteria group bacterium GW2011_GWA2_31_28]